MNYKIFIPILLLAGCATVQKDFTARTTATYSPTAGISYDSTKNQENFKAHVKFAPDGKVTELDVETTATTPEAAIAAAQQSQAQALKIANDALSVLLPILKSVVGMP